MKDLLKKWFRKPDESIQEKEGKGKFMPESKIPADENFIINFTKNGGKFLYCVSLDEVYDSFEEILSENRWHGREVLCLDDSLLGLFKQFDVKYSKNNYNASFFVTSCEYLIAEIGAIFVCSNQLRENKLNDLPSDFVVYATTSQLVESLDSGLQGIKQKYKNKIPSGITTLQHFQVKEEKDFLSYGSSTKSLYLLLLEDL